MDLAVIAAAECIIMSLRVFVLKLIVTIVMTLSQLLMLPIVTVILTVVVGQCW
jgi:hypothetical protein